MPEQNDQPKIFVDSDWKAEAQREKEELDRETRELPQPGELPEPSILELVQMVIMQASIGLGGYQDPQTGQRIPANMPLARHYIDLLALLEEKTRDRLDPEEKTVVDATLNELRMAFVQLSGTQQGPGARGQAPEKTPKP